MQLFCGFNLRVVRVVKWRVVASVLLVVSGSVACYKAVELVRLWTQQGVSVQVVMTAAAARLVGAATFRAVSGKPVLVDEWRAPQHADGMDHIALGRAADALVVAPASADFLAKAASGVADDLALATFLAADCRKFVAPAMNQQMWNAPPTARNIQTLAADGVSVLGPAAGEQACGEYGMGRMLEPHEIIDCVAETLAHPPPKARTNAKEVSALAGVNIVISTGATEEPLDAMRIITNKSSGAMGFCLATAATAMGANVHIIAGRTTAPPPPGIPLHTARTGADMHAAVMSHLAQLRNGDWFFSVAAVADFGLSQPLASKPNRAHGEWCLTLQATRDILADAQKQFPHVVCCGFAAQAEAGKQAVAAARKKMQAKGVPYIVLNSTNDADRTDCTLTLVESRTAKPLQLARMPKPQAARQLLAALFPHTKAKEND